MRGLSLVAASGGHSSSQCAGLSPSRPLLCGAQAPDAQAQQLWLTGPVTPRHVGSSQTRAGTCVPCIGRQILNHCATREALCILLLGHILYTYHLKYKISVQKVDVTKQYIFMPLRVKVFEFPVYEVENSNKFMFPQLLTSVLWLNFGATFVVPKFWNRYRH